MFSSSFFYMFCIKGHIPRTLPNSPSVTTSQQKRLEKWVQLCNVFIYHVARAEYFLIPDDAVDRRELGFQILLFKQQFKASLEQFYMFKKVDLWNL